MVTPEYIRGVMGEVSLSLQPATAVLLNPDSSQTSIQESGVNIALDLLERAHLPEPQLQEALDELGFLAETQQMVYTGQVPLLLRETDFGNSLDFTGTFQASEQLSGREYRLRISQRLRKSDSGEPHLTVSVIPFRIGEEEATSYITSRLQQTSIRGSDYSMDIQSASYYGRVQWDQPTDFSRALIAARQKLNYRHPDNPKFSFLEHGNQNDPIQMIERFLNFNRMVYETLRASVR